MYKIIVASHGPMAEGMKKSLEFVMGPAENVTALCLDEEGISKFSKEAKRLLDEQDTEEVLVMVDFLFGSPFNEFSKLAAGYAGKMEIITGVIPQIKEAAVMKTLREILAEEESGDDDE